MTRKHWGYLATIHVVGHWYSSALKLTRVQIAVHSYKVIFFQVDSCLWAMFPSERYWVQAPISLFLVLWTLPSVKVEVAVHMAAFWSTSISCCSCCVSPPCYWPSCLRLLNDTTCHCGQDALQWPDTDHNSLGVGNLGFTVRVRGKNDRDFGHKVKKVKRDVEKLYVWDIKLLYDTWNDTCLDHPQVRQRVWWRDYNWQRKCSW